jgi:hypothetical protein
MEGASFRAGITMEILETGISACKDKSVFVMEIGWAGNSFQDRRVPLGKILH